MGVAGWSQSAYHTDVVRAWRVDSSAERFTPVATDGVRCRNPYWTSPAPAVPAEHIANALSFTAPPGRARLYVYQAIGRGTEPLATFTLALNGDVVARTAAGTFVTLDVPPGRHRFSARHRDERTLDVDAHAGGEQLAEEPPGQPVGHHVVADPR